MIRSSPSVGDSARVPVGVRHGEAALDADEFRRAVLRRPALAADGHRLGARHPDEGTPTAIRTLSRMHDLG